MANPRPDLQGFADPTADPQWREKAIARVAQHQQQTGRRAERRNALSMFFDDPFKLLLDAAAQERDISLNGYARRAIGSFIAYDLDLDIEEVLQHCALPTAYGASGGGRLKRTNDTGLGMGLWTITGLER